jgi:hypothetical protein
MQKLFFLLLIILPFSASFSQDTIQGQVQIIQDARIDTLLEKHIIANEFDPNIDGYRIQIFFEAGNNSKRMANEAKAEFAVKYPEAPNYILFQEPYYKVRIGDYKTKMEAEKFLKEIEKEYPNAFVVRDKINFPKLD